MEIPLAPDFPPNFGDALIGIGDRLETTSIKRRHHALPLTVSLHPTLSWLVCPGFASYRI